MTACCHTSTAWPASEFGPCSPPETPRIWRRFAVAAVLAGLSMQLSLGVNLSPVTGRTRLWTHGGLAIAALLALVLLGGPILRRSWAAGRAGRVTLEQLFLLGIAGALGASLYSSLTGVGAIYYELVSVLAAVYTIGQILVERQRARVGASLHHLLDSLRTATVVTCCGKRRTALISELQAGERVRIEKGRRIPVDGLVAEGSAYVQEIAHTGEPFPVAKTVGDRVLAGTIALDGDLIVAVPEAPGNHELQRLARRLEIALDQRSDWQREADRWMTWFVPVVIAVAAGAFAFWRWRAGWHDALFNFLSVLLIACPCGLGLGVPIALWHAMHRLTLLGIVPAGGELIERLARVKTVIFDKTGTLTEEEITLEALIVLDQTNLPGLRARLALIESHSDHPVARPFSALAPNQILPPWKLLAIEAIPGRGVAARLARETGDITEVRLGNRGLLQPRHDPALEELRSRIPNLSQSRRELFIIENEQLSAIALLGENIRPAVAGLAPRLRALSLSLGIMTGDASPNEFRWTELGLHVSSGMTTAAKAAAVRALEARHEHVLFIGDGLNDSEAMAAASAGLLIHGGDNVTRTHAHGELPGSSLAHLPEAIALSRAACRQIRLILRISLLYNSIGLLLATTGWLNPIAAAAIMFASSLTVVAVAARSGS